ncbi:MAG: DUF4402 domain-containing protein [Pseudomonadota bacterium]
MKHVCTSLAVAAAAALSMPGSAFAGNYVAPNKDSTGKVIILDPLSFIKIDDLSFGGYVIPASGSGTVTVDAVTGTVGLGGTITQMPQFTPSRGRMMGAGTASQAVSVEAVLPDKLYLNGNLSSTTWINVALDLDQVADVNGRYSYTVGTDKVFDVFIGGDVTISSGMSPGLYANEYTITATYQ